MATVRLCGRIAGELTVCSFLGVHLAMLSVVPGIRAGYVATRLHHKRATDRSDLQYNKSHKNWYKTGRCSDDRYFSLWALAQTAPQSARFDTGSASRTGRLCDHDHQQDRSRGATPLAAAGGSAGGPVGTNSCRARGLSQSGTCQAPRKARWRSSPDLDVRYRAPTDQLAHEPPDATDPTDRAHPRGGQCLRAPAACRGATAHPHRHRWRWENPRSTPGCARAARPV